MENYNLEHELSDELVTLSHDDYGDDMWTLIKTRKDYVCHNKKQSEKRNKSISTAHHSILIGDGLFTDKSYHLLVNKNGVKIDKIMSKNEYQLIVDITKALGIIK